MARSVPDILSALIHQTPYGEIEPVLADLSALAASSGTPDLDAVLAAAARSHLAAQHTLLPLTPDPSSPDVTDGFVLLASASNSSLHDPNSNSNDGAPELDSPVFFDPERSVAFTVTPGLRAVPCDEETTMRLRGTFDQTPAYAEFAAAAKSYCENRYLEASRPRVVVYPHPEGGLTIVTRGARASAKNCWSGAWFGAYTFAPQNGGSLRGELRVQVHLYEDGNVQLSPNATLARGSGVGTSASEVFAALTQFEEEAHAAIEEACATLARGAFKTLRRALPITGEKFDFGSGAHSLANELMKH